MQLVNGVRGIQLRLHDGVQKPRGEAVPGLGIS